MTSFKRLATLTIGLTVLVAAQASAAPVAGAPPDETAGLRLQVMGSGGTREGTCFLVRKEAHDHDVLYYFLTSARLLEPEGLGEQRTSALRIRIVVDQSHAIETSAQDVLLPGGTEHGVDLAIVKAIAADSGLVPVVVAEPPAMNQVFIVRGHQGNDLTVITERVASRSARQVIGDRAMASGGELVGAPAMVEGGVFGLVSEGSATQAPAITLLSAARGFLAEGIPGWRSGEAAGLTAAAAASPAFRLEQRVIDVPVPAEGAGTRDVDVPIQLGPEESLVDASAMYVPPLRQGQHQGEITVLRLQNNLVRLHFKTEGIPPATTPTTNGPRWQSLITVQVNVVVIPR